jgi:hypothetical protein
MDAHCTVIVRGKLRFKIGGPIFKGFIAFKKNIFPGSPIICLLSFTSPMYGSMKEM